MHWLSWNQALKPFMVAIEFTLIWLGEIKGFSRMRSILDSEGVSATVDALSCRPKSAATLTCSKDVAFLAKNVSILCVVFLFLEILSFSPASFEHHFYACDQTSLNRV